MLNDLRFAFRQLRKSPGFTFAAILTLALCTLLFGVSASDPLIFFAVSLLLGCAAVIACWIPAHRASRIDPIITLRAE